MRITRVYTRTGDRGETRLVGGKAVPKDHVRIEAYGTVDELNAIIGLIRTFLSMSSAEPTAKQTLDTMLEEIQHQLFDVGSELATPPESRWDGMIPIGDVDTTLLETWIDQLNEELPPLKEFILPGGGPVGSFFHQGRTVCRRADREVLRLITEEPDTGEGVLRYLNRLSDWLFVAGRWSAKACNEAEHLWRGRRRPNV